MFIGFDAIVFRDAVFANHDLSRHHFIRVLGWHRGYLPMQRRHLPIVAADLAGLGSIAGVCHHLPPPFKKPPNDIHAQRLDYRLRRHHAIGSGLHLHRNRLKITRSRVRSRCTIRLT